MKLKNFRLLTVVILGAIANINALAQIPAGYYDGLKGKKGAELKTAVHNIIKNAKVLDYGPGKGATWWGFYTTDNDNGYVIDRYSNKKVKFGAQGQVPGGMNIEHSFPKSWWGGTKTQAYKDLFNLMPSDSKANSSKSNYGMGVVTQTSGKGYYDNGCIKVGTGAQNKKYWQPSDEWRGDFSRAYMYMATAYQDYKWSGEQALISLEQGDYPTLKEWASKLYIKWGKLDPVSQLEVKRNNAVYKIQGNRNPFIDFPNLPDYIWGDSVNYAFDPAKTVTSESYTGGSGTTDPTDPTEETIYTANFKSTDGSCTVKDDVAPTQDDSAWKRNNKYGWVGTAYINGTRHAADSRLFTPVIDLTDYTSAKLLFKHAVNFLSNPSSMLSVEVTDEETKTTTKLDGITWPKGNSWTFNESGDVDLTAFAGKRITISFHYTSNESVNATWEIMDIAVTGTKATSSIGSVTTTTVAFNPAMPYTAYDIAGRRITSLNNHKGIALVKQNGKTFKIMCK